MSLDLADLLTSTSSPEGMGLLEGVRASWPLNGKVAGLERETDISDRVRLRRVLQTLDEWGIASSGIEPSHHRASAQVYFEGAFSSSGSLKQIALDVRLEDNDLLEQVQMALQSAGWPAVVSRHGQIEAPRSPVDDEHVEWLELGFLHPLDGLTAEQAATWIEACPLLDNSISLEAAAASGLTPQQLAPWAALADKDGRAFLLNKPHFAKAWIEAGLTPEDALPWFEADNHLLNFSLVDEWRARGCGPLEAKAWINLLPWGADPKKTDSWLRKGFTDKHAVRILQSEGSSWSARSISDQSGASAAETVAWIESGVTNASYVQLWVEIGITGRELRRWNRAFKQGGGERYLKREEVAAWIDSGLSVSDAEPWLELNYRFIDRGLVEEWQQEGLAPEDARDWARSGVAELSEVRAWQAIHPACSDPQLVGSLVASGLKPFQAGLVLDKLK